MSEQTLSLIFFIAFLVLLLAGPLLALAWAGIQRLRTLASRATQAEDALARSRREVAHYRYRFGLLETPEVPS